MMSIDSSFNNISNSNLTVGITTETLKDIIKPYKLSIELLKEKLSHALPLEEKIKLENQLIWAKKELEKKIEVMIDCLKLPIFCKSKMILKMQKNTTPKHLR